jgi:anti-sigma-K factor RskA
VIDERQQDQASLYALGALDAQEAREFEALLRDNPELQTLVRELRAVAEGIAGTVAALEPPARVKAKLMLQLEEQPRPASVTPLQARRRPVSVWIPWAIAAGLAMVSLGFIYQSAGLKAELVAQARRIEELGMSLEVAQAETGDLRQTVARLRESNRLAAIRIALLDSLVAADPKAVAVSVWDNERQSGVFIVRNLKPAPTDKDYQLWIIDPMYPSPVDAGVFQVDAQGNGREEFHSRAPIQSAKQFAVTIEKKGGAEIPNTKATVLAGT